MDIVLSAVTMGRALRAKHQLKVRQPLPKLTLITHDPEAQRVLDELGELITDELNVKTLEVTPDEGGLVDLSAKANFKVLGPRLGKQMKSAAQAFSLLAPEQIQNVLNGNSVTVKIEGEPMDFGPDEILVQRQQKEGLLVETDDRLSVVLDTTLTPELVQEGLAREFVNKVQNMRKDLDLDVMDRIQVGFQSTAAVQAALDTHSGFVCTETLCDQLESQDSTEGTEWDLNGESCRITVERTAGG